MQVDACKVLWAGCTDMQVSTCKVLWSRVYGPMAMKGWMASFTRNLLCTGSCICMRNNKDSMFRS